MNYTPLDVSLIKQREHGSFDFKVVFLSLIVLTLTVIAVLLFILIQKKLQELAGVLIYA